MRTILLLERFREGKLVEVREQLSQSYTLEFMRVLYAQQAQSGASAANFAMNFGSGDIAYQRHGVWGILVGRGTTAPSPNDITLEYPIFHGRTYLAALQAKLTNPSFETGDFTGWTASGCSVSAGWSATGKYAVYCSLIGTAYVQQALDFTNITALKMSCSHYNLNVSRIRVYVDAVLVYDDDPSGSPTHWVQVIPVSFTGTKTLKFQFDCSGLGTWGYLDAIETFGTQLEYGGCEVTFPTFSGGNGEMTIRRYIYNRSGSSTTINEVGLVAYPGRLILRDVVPGGVALANTETLRVTYQMQVIV